MQKETRIERTKNRLPCSADLDLLSSLLGSQRKMNNELQLYLQQADERSIKLPVVKRSKINEKLEELLVRHGHYEATDSDAEDSSSADSEDDHTTATGSNEKNSQLHNFTTSHLTCIRQQYDDDIIISEYASCSRLSRKDKP